MLAESEAEPNTKQKTIKTTQRRLKSLHTYGRTQTTVAAVGVRRTLAAVASLGW